MDDKIDKSLLDPLNMNYMQVYFNSLSGVDAYVTFGDSLTELTSREKVQTSLKVNYTEAPTANYYLTLLPKANTRLGDHSIDITLKYYQYDP